MKLKNFQTSDLNLTACLIAEEYQLVGFLRRADGKAEFIFKRSPQLQETINQYWEETIRVNPHKLYSALKKLKNRIYSDVSDTKER